MNLFAEMRDLPSERPEGTRLWTQQGMFILKALDDEASSALRPSHPPRGPSTELSVAPIC